MSVVAAQIGGALHSA